MASPNSALIALSSAVFSAGALQFQVGLPASAAKALMAWITDWNSSWANSTAPSIWSSVSSLASDSTISTAVSVPATTMSRLEAFSCS
ncbi:hypothetical protein D9M70_531590 [compost metagenome]